MISARGLEKGVLMKGLGRVEGRKRLKMDERELLFVRLGNLPLCRERSHFLLYGIK